MYSEQSGEHSCSHQSATHSLLSLPSARPNRPRRASQGRTMHLSEEENNAQGLAVSSSQERTMLRSSPIRLSRRSHRVFDPPRR